MGLKTPVLLIIFNRPDTTQQVFDAIRQAQPRQLFVAADGPRENSQEDIEKCSDVRRIIDEGIDWSCEIHRLYRDNNLGCKLAPASAITWFFENVEAGIILEDDCVPHHTFFPFCEELLEKYRDDERVAAIGGSNLLLEWPKDTQSYYFSLLGGNWGWASWRRAWRYFDLEIESWRQVLRSGIIEGLFPNPRHSAFWKDIMQQVYDKKIKTAWDYQWLLACWLQNGWRIVPRVNLVSNIGFGTDATHLQDVSSPLANLPAAEIGFPLEHPTFMTRSYELDEALSDKYYSVKVDSTFRRLRRRVATLLRV